MSFRSKRDKDGKRVVYSIRTREEAVLAELDKALRERGIEPEPLAPTLEQQLDRLNERIRADVLSEAKDRLLKQSSESVAKWLGSELGREVTVDGLYAVLSRYRGKAGSHSGVVGMKQGGEEETFIQDVPGQPVTPKTHAPPSLMESKRNVELAAERMRELRASLTPAERDAVREADTIRRRFDRIAEAVQEGRITISSQEELTEYLEGRKKLPYRERTSTPSPSDEFFDEATKEGSALSD
jgi:hypothetical protein